MFRLQCLGLLFAIVVPAQVVSLPAFSTFLKANGTIKQVATDSQGNIYVFGETNINPTSGFPQDVYVARLDPATAKVIYEVELGGSANQTRAGAFTVDAAGNAYLAGYTESSDFPTVPAAPDTASTSTDLAFAAKLNINGAIVFSVLFSNGISAYPGAVAADNSGDVIISGTSSSRFPTTAGAYNNAWTSNLPFVTKLDPTGTKTIFSSIGIGGTSLAVGPADDIYIAGTTGAPYGPNLPLYPATPGAFQTTYTPIVICPPTPCMIPETLGQQYVTKLSADGSTLLYSTFVTGSAGSYNAGMAVDAAGDVWLTGDTASPDYPYTQPITAPSLADTFITELDPTGSKVLLSVPQGVPPGTGNNLAFDPQGNLLVVGNFPSPSVTTVPPNVIPAPAPPATGSVPSPCLAGQGVYVLRISSQDGAVLGARILPGGRGGVGSAVDSQGNLYIVGSTRLPDVPLTPGVAYDTAVTRRVVAGSFLERTNFELPVSPLGCVSDSVTMSPLGPVAPGQLITLYGNGIGPAQAATGLTAGTGSVATSLGGVTVTFNGQPAPILYVSSTQINVQAPFEIDQNPYTPAENTVMQLSYGGSVLATRLFAVTPVNPSIFLQASTPCAIGYGQPAFALNEDGSINSCTNPAAAGSRFTLFINGIGTKSNGGTGLLLANPEGVDATAALFDGFYSLEVDNFTSQPGAISGIGQLTARAPQTITSPQAMSVTFSMDGVIAGPLAGGSGEGAANSEIPAVVFVKPWQPF